MSGKVPSSWQMLKSQLSGFIQPALALLGLGLLGGKKEEKNTRVSESLGLGLLKKNNSRVASWNKHVLDY
jgi:hypothetical protein